MDGNLEFRVLCFYLGALYLIPVIYWRKTRAATPVLGVRGQRQLRGRQVALALFLIPLANYVLGGPWPTYAFLNLPDGLRWLAAIPATLAILLMVWACHHTVGGPTSGGEREAWFVDDGPYQSIRHPQLLATMIFFLSLAVMASNGLILIATCAGALLLRLVVAPAVETDLAAAYGNPYEVYRERTGGFLFRLRRIPKAQYTVPRRFGLFAVLALTTIFAMLFGALNYMRAPPLVYLFVSTEISAICLVQILFGSAARSGSAVTGAILLPFWTAISVAAERHRLDTLETIIGGLFLAIVGALLGYCIGTLAAGFFLAMDMLEPYLPGAKSPSLNALGTKPDQNVNQA